MPANDTNTSEEVPDQRSAVREEYGTIATTGEQCCQPASGNAAVDDRTLGLGYDSKDVETAPAESNLGLGCGNPVALSNLEPGEIVLDLGSGGGFDCFLAAEEVGPAGHVIGVDMTPEMLDRARKNAAESDRSNVEFRLGEIEHLPVADSSVDVVISNCVLTLSPATADVLAEAFRVLRPGGRLSISDLVVSDPIPTPERPAGGNCAGNPDSIAEYERWLADVGFEAISVTVESEWSDTDGEVPVVSARVEAKKPPV